MDFGINLNAQYANGVTHFKSVAKSGKGMCFDNRRHLAKFWAIL